jgi:hypothetical protein
LAGEGKVLRLTDTHVLVLQGSRCAPNLRPRSGRTGQVPTTFSQVSAYLPLTLRCPFLNRVSQVRILPGAPPLTRQNQPWPAQTSVKADLVFCHCLSSSGLICHRSRNHRETANGPGDSYGSTPTASPRRFHACRPEPGSLSDRPSRQTGCGGRRAVPCQCRFVWRRAEGRDALPPPDHR